MTDPTDRPVPVPGLPELGRAPVLVTGGTGTLGRHVVQELQRSGTPVTVLTRRADPASPEQLTGDLATGDGLEAAVQGVAAVVHCATSQKQTQQVDVQGTRRLCAALQQHAPNARLVYISIVGCWDNPLPYYRHKCEAEQVVTGSGRSHAIVRATQFHDLVYRLCSGARLGPLSAGVRGLRFAPCEAAWVAARLVDAALDDADDSPAVRELTGPEVMTARELMVLTAHVEGRRTPRVLQLPPVGGVLKAFAAGSNLAGPDARSGGIGYATWLARRVADSSSR